MFNSLSQSQTSLPDLTDDLSQNFGIEISKEALHKKFNSQAVDFLKSVLQLQLSEHIDFKLDDSIKCHFEAIHIKDSSKFSLPSTYYGQYPGYGNFSKINGLMNIQYEYDLISGNWTSLELTSTKRNDQQDSKETVDRIQKGDLHIRDLGYITPTYLKAVLNKEAYFLNRLPPQINVYETDRTPINWNKISGKFNKSRTSIVEMDVLIYEKELLPCRLILEPVSKKEYDKRIKSAKSKAKSWGVGISKLHKIKCRYNMFITNVEKEKLSLDKVRKTYYLRWQIELVFKTWKSFFKINEVKKVKKERLECQIWAKLIWILLNWRLFQACKIYLRRTNTQKTMSLLKFFKKCVKFSESFRNVILGKLTLDNWLTNSFLPLICNLILEAPKDKQTHYQILINNLYA